MGCQVKVLIAEDSFLVGEMIQAVVEEAGCTVVGRAADGRQAVEMTTELRPDVVVMDIKMPDLDGIEASEIIQNRCPTPVVILTAYDTPEMLKEASAAGVGAFLVWWLVKVPTTGRWPATRRSADSARWPTSGIS